MGLLFLLVCQGKRMHISWRVWRMGIALILSSLYLTGGGLLFWTLEGETFSTSPYGNAIEGKQWGSYLNAIYFCAVTLTTIGYGDLVPTTTTARSILIVYAIIGLCIMGFTMASISHVAVSYTHYYLRLGGSFLFSEQVRKAASIVGGD